MRMKGLVLASVLAASTMAMADLLLWQVGGTNISYDYAQIFYNTVNSYEGGTAIANKVGDYAGTSEKIGATTFDYASVGAVLGAYTTSQYFFIELFDANNKLVGKSEIAERGSLSNYIAASEFSAGFADKNAWTGGKYTSTAVPEPTSGLLLLIGAAMMGLRRKRA